MWNRCKECISLSDSSLGLSPVITCSVIFNGISQNTARSKIENTELLRTGYKNLDN